jgi:hypothetical protein
MSNDPNIEFIRWQIRVQSEHDALMSIVSTLYKTLPNQTSSFDEVYRQLKTHYRAQRLSELQETDSDLFDVVDDFDWDSYNPLEIRRPQEE